jgi:hypothetical protein
MLGRRMAGVCVVAVGMLGGVTGQKKGPPPACPRDTPCRKVANPVEAVCSRVAAGQDGLIRYTVFFNSRDTAQVTAFTLAMGMWNCYSSVTGIKFERTEDKRKAHIQFQEGKESNNPANRACAAYDPGGSLIWYSQALMEWARSSPQIAARVYAHELGHALALCHFPRKGKASSIMHEGPERETDCRRVAEYELTDVQIADAESARDCARGVQKDCEIVWVNEQISIMITVLLLI